MAGFLMNFTPCVLPVIGLKLKAFTGSSRWYYVAGVMCSFMVLATCSLLLGTGLSFMGFGHYRLTLCLVCFLFGVWHMPTFGVQGNLGSFGMGILTTALGSSCSVPFLAPAMAYTASCSVLETYLLFGALGVDSVAHSSCHYRRSSDSKDIISLGSRTCVLGHWWLPPCGCS